MAPATFFSDGNSPVVPPIGTPVRTLGQVQAAQNGRAVSNSVWARFNEIVKQDEQKAAFIEVYENSP